MPASRQDYPELMRRMLALIEVDGREGEMVFLSNNLEWSAQSLRGTLPLPLADPSLFQADHRLGQPIPWFVAFIFQTRFPILTSVRRQCFEKPTPPCNAPPSAGNFAKANDDCEFEMEAPCAADVEAYRRRYGTSSMLKCRISEREKYRPSFSRRPRQRTISPS
jgi:hypothetical protein